MPKETVIETKKLSKKILLQSSRDLNILEDINLIVRQGDSVAITGTSGSGKTTLLALLAGLDLPTGGEIRLLGQDIVNLDEDQRASLRLGKIGFVYQSFHLMSHLTALENVMLPLELDTTSANNPGDIRQRAEAALQQVGLTQRLGHLPTQLSGGEQQRVALARAFVTEPVVLFADEPTGNLDQLTGEEIIELLFSMQQERQTTLVLVTHDDALAQRCKRHYNLKDGGLVQQ